MGPAFHHARRSKRSTREKAKARLYDGTDDRHTTLATRAAYPRTGRPWVPLRAAQTRDELLGVISDELIDRLLDDFGDIAVARLGDRLERLDATRLSKLDAARKRQK